MPEALGRPEDKGLTYSGIQGSYSPFFIKSKRILPKPNSKAINTREYSSAYFTNK
jgi:hypothetical protein